MQQKGGKACHGPSSFWMAMPLNSSGFKGFRTHWSHEVKLGLVQFRVINLSCATTKTPGKNPRRRSPRRRKQRLAKMMTAGVLAIFLMIITTSQQVAHPLFRDFKRLILKYGMHPWNHRLKVKPLPLAAQQRTEKGLKAFTQDYNALQCD